MADRPCRECGSRGGPREDLRALLAQARRRGEGSGRYAEACRDVAGHYERALAELETAEVRWRVMLAGLARPPPPPKEENHG